MHSALTWFIRVWIGLAILVNLVAVVSIIYFAPTFWEGVDKVAEIFNPFNVFNLAMEILLLSPALLALWWRDARAKNA